MNTVVSADKVVNKTNSIMDILVSVVDEFGVSVANGTVKSTIDGTGILLLLIMVKLYLRMLSYWGSRYFQL